MDDRAIPIASHGIVFTLLTFRLGSCPIFALESCIPGSPLVRNGLDNQGSAAEGDDQQHYAHQPSHDLASFFLVPASSSICLLASVLSCLADLRFAFFLFLPPGAHHHDRKKLPSPHTGVVSGRRLTILWIVI